MTKIYGQFGLFANGGIPIYSSDKESTSDFTLIMVPEFPVSNPKIIASGNPNQIKKRFEGAEHTFIGNQINIQLPGGDILGSEINFKLDNGATLSYGQVLALSGDFYGIPDSPICQGGSEVFLKAFQTLWSGNLKELENILFVMNEEIAMVNDAVNKGSTVSDAYDEIGEYNSARFNIITLGNYTKIIWENIPKGLPSLLYLPFLVNHGRYLDLASNNLDHFGNNALLAYKIGHEQALLLAVEAGDKKDLELLKKAYALNAYADHFLTDLFAAGHLRVPRAQMLDFTNDTLANILVKLMHDEDNKWGLNVSNLNNEKWRCFGDGHFFDEVNSPNGAIIAQAVQASADDIFNAYSNPSMYKYAHFTTALKHIPILSEVLDYKNTSNYSAMYIWAYGEVAERDPINNRGANNWTSYWTVWTALFKRNNMNTSTPPDNYLSPPPNSNDIKYDPGNWLINAPSGTNWVKGNEVRYAISNINDDMESNKGNWCDWIEINKYAKPLLILPTFVTGANYKGVKYYRVYRQFKVNGVLSAFEVIGKTKITDLNFQDRY